MHVLFEDQTMEPPIIPLVKDEFDLGTQILMFTVTTKVEAILQLMMKKIVALIPQNRTIFFFNS